MSRQRLLIITRDPTSAQLGGNAIRAAQIAQALAADHDVTLASPGEDPLLGVPHHAWTPGRPATLSDVVNAADAVIAMPQDPATHALLRRSGARLIFDLYDPYPLEVLEAFAGAPARQRRLHETITGDSFFEAMRIGHHFVCASERQRDLWLGSMLALGLIRGETYRADPTFRGRLDVVSLCLPEAPPPPGRGPREHFGDAIGRDDDVIVWFGGLWNWVDPLTAVEAMALLRERRPQARLVVVAPPASDDPSGRVARETRALARQLGLSGTTVLFTDERVPYADRGAWLLQAGCGVSLHADHLETRFAFRTRLLDYLWARVPIVCTSGDELGDMVEREDLGVVAPPGDADAVAAAFETVLTRGRPDYEASFEGMAQRFGSTAVSEPLRRMLQLERPRRLGQGALVPARPGPPVRALLTRALRAAQRAVSR